MNLGQHAADLAGQLAASGVPVALDPRDARIPGAVLQVDRIDNPRLDRVLVDVTWRLVILGSTAGTVPALDTLGDLVSKLAAVVPLEDLEATAFTLPNLSPDPVPAFTATITTECED